MKLALSTLVFLVSLAAESGLEAPRLGLWCDDAGNVRPLYGVAGAFIAGPPQYSGALAAAWFGEGGWVLLPGRLLRLGPAAEVRAEALIDAPAPARFGPLSAEVGGRRFRWHGRSLLPEATLEEADFPVPPTWAAGRLELGPGASLPLAHPPDRLDPLGPGWWFVSSGGRGYAVSARPGRAGLWVLPAPAPEADHAQP